MKKLLLYLPAVGLLLMILGSAFPSSTAIVQTAPQIADGMVEHLQPMTAAKIVNDAALGCPECFRWEKVFVDNTKGFMFARPFKDAWGFVVTGCNNSTWLKILRDGGNIVNKNTFTEFVRGLETQGWRPVTPSQLPEFFAKTGTWIIGSYNALQYSAYSASKTGTFFISVPLSAFGVAELTTDN